MIKPENILIVSFLITMLLYIFVKLVHKYQCDHSISLIELEMKKVQCKLIEKFNTVQQLPLTAVFFVNSKYYIAIRYKKWSFFRKNKFEYNLVNSNNILIGIYDTDELDKLVSHIIKQDKIDIINYRKKSLEKDFI